MNAYELATGLENHFKGNFITSESALLLRQQADRIAELESCLEMIATGSIKNEPKNYKDTVKVMQEIAKEAILRKAQKK